jgi:DNA replication protein
MKAQKGFSGFPAGKLRTTPVPNLFYSELLPAIDHLGELKLTLYAFWALAQKEGRHRYLRESEIAADEVFMRSFDSGGQDPREKLADALERAVARGTFLKAVLTFADDEEALYFLNTPKGRAAIEGIERGDWRPTGIEDHPVELKVERPNIFVLYEQNIGALTPMIADRLREAEDSYPAAWIEDAIRIAVENNVRKWRYVEAILEDWDKRGRDEREDRGDSEKARRRYVEGDFSDFIER